MSEFAEVIALIAGAISAAGLGMRLRKISGNTPKAFFRIHGKELLWYPLKVFKTVGVIDSCVATPPGYSSEAVYVAQDAGVRVRIVENHKYLLGNGYSLYMSVACASSFSDFIIASVTDHLYTGAVPMAVLKKLQEGYAAVVAGDRNPKYVSLEEATKISVSGDGRLKVGKDIDRWTWIDMGVFGFRRDAVSLIGECLERAPTISGVLECLSRKIDVAVADVTGVPWSDVDSMDDFIDLVIGGRREVLDVVWRWVNGWRTG